MSIVSNTSPLTSLAAIGALDILRQLYGTITIPDAVQRELAALDTHHAGSVSFEKYPWIHVSPVSNRVLLDVLRQELDSGESEAIALALETNAEFLLIDERLGRRVATNLGIRVAGLLGVLVEAKARCFITAVKPMIDNLIEKAGFRVSSQLYQRILQETDEESRRVNFSPK